MPSISANETLNAHLRSGNRLGAWCSFASYSCVELMASLGYDFILMDTQHSEITLANFPAYLGAFSGGPTHPIVRAPKNDYHAINWLLDQGVHGVMVPMVNSPEAAQEAVRAAKFLRSADEASAPFARQGMAQRSTHTFRWQMSPPQSSCRSRTQRQRKTSTTS